jgi:MFS family permease
MKVLTRTILLLSFVSLFNDIASEMLTPVMPIYLKSIGFSVLLIGILEGAAEATAGLSKGYFGRYSDLTGKRMPFVRLGYAMSMVAKPMMALLASVPWIFSARTLERLGKGVRTAARDAVLSDEATPATKGKVFGFHRAMDTCGAVLGPLAALIYLGLYPGQYTSLFLLTLLPGIAATSLTFLIREKKRGMAAPSKRKNTFLSFIHYWKEATPGYRRLVTGLLLFALFNSSDVFLLLKVKEATHDDAAVIRIYIFYNLVYALTSYPLGSLGDRIGLKKVFLGGLLLFAGVYTGMAWCDRTWMFYALFAVYGIYAAATEGISKAWITNSCEKKDTATAIGTFTAFQSICTMLASCIAGALWYGLNAQWTFLLTAGITLVVFVYMLREE